MTLALMHLTTHDADDYGARTWKGHDWAVLDRLHEQGWISDPKSKAKSVVFTKEGLRRSRELFERHFGSEED
jgi:hypothetical protein